MTERSETGREGRQHRRGQTPGGRIDWSRLFDRESTEAAMAEIAQVLGQVAVGERATLSEPARTSLEPSAPVPPETADLSTEALEAWKAARESLTRMEARLEARSRELGLLQVVGQKAAEARSAAELFSLATEVLQDASDLEMILVVHRLQGDTEVRGFLSRPLGGTVLEDLSRESLRFLEWDPQDARKARAEPLGTFDDARWPLTAFREQDVVMLPVLRRGRPVACLTLLHSNRPEEGRLRVLYSAANQLSVHIDRIMTVQEAEESRFRSILDSMPQAVLLTDLSLRVLQANPAALRLERKLGLSGREGGIRSVGKLDIEKLAEPVRSGVSGKVGAETRLDGGEVFEVTVSPFHSEAGTTDGLLLIISDVTESRRMQEQLTQADKMSSIGQMISGVAHELNNPLASIMGYAQLLRSTTKDTKLSERLGVLYQESRRCQRIVQKLLSFVRHHEPERRALSIHEIASSVIALMKYQLRVDGVEVETEYDLSVAPVVGDGHQLQQALLNLITNAHHALRKRGGNGRIVVRTRRVSGSRVALEVEDDGPGIPVEIRSRIFDPFFTTKGPGEGTGLGLSLVYGTVNAHGGTVRADLGALGGARFVIELPTESEPEAEESESPGREEAEAFEPLRVLVVDDEEALASLLRDSLATDGHEVLVSNTGAGALSHLGGGDVDLVILDYRMPDMGGERLHREIRLHRPELLDRLILTSGDTVSREPDRFARDNGMPLLHKPFDLDDLRRLVRERARADGKVRP